MIISKRERRIDNAHVWKAIFNAVYNEVGYVREAVDGMLSGKSVPEGEKWEVREVTFPSQIPAWEVWIRRIFEYITEGSGHKPRERRQGVSVLVFIPSARVKVLAVWPSRAKDRGEPSIADCEFLGEGIVDRQSFPGVIAHRDARIDCSEPIRRISQLILANEAVV
jgi:hypothetical protein